MDVRRSITRLDPSVISRIAAGEVVKRPASAVKEMIENSLDAKATSIQVFVKNGGMKYLQIIDNGVGIKKEDLEIVCERFTTSKLESVDDLRSMATYGFRGEALSSISHISHVFLKTKTEEERCGYKVSYSGGTPIGKPVPCAANQGTQITVENMFHNVPLRQKILKNFNEEYKKIWDIVARYAVHNASVSFTLKKCGENNMGIKTIANSNTKDVISSVFGKDISRNLLETRGSEETIQLKYEILASNLNYSSPQLMFLLFINHRLVKVEGLRKEIIELYSVYLPRKTYPFVYISLEMAPENVDVNIHPTKENVFYLYEESINKKIVTAIQQLIVGKDAYKTYKEVALALSQTENSHHIFEKTVNHENAMGSEKECLAIEYRRNEEKPNSSEGGVEQIVKHDSKVVDGSTTANDHVGDSLFDLDSDDVIVTINDFDITQNSCDDEVPRRAFDHCDQQESSLIPEQSLGVLKKNIIDACDRQLKCLIEASVFVTCPDYRHMIIRNNNSLYLCKLKPLCQEYFYQVMINEYERCGRLNFKDPVPVLPLIQHAHSGKYGSSETAIQIIQQNLMDNIKILENYSINIDKNGNLLSLPLLLENYFPSKELLPDFIVNLAYVLPWNKRCSCIHEICLEIASYYSKFPRSKRTSMNLGEWSNFVELTLFPNMKKHLLISTECFPNHITEILNITSFVDHW